MDAITVPPPSRELAVTLFIPTSSGSWTPSPLTSYQTRSPTGGGAPIAEVHVGEALAGGHGHGRRVRAWPCRRRRRLARPLPARRRVTATVYVPAGRLAKE